MIKSSCGGKGPIVTNYSWSYLSEGLCQVTITESLTSPRHAIDSHTDRHTAYTLVPMHTHKYAHAYTLSLQAACPEGTPCHPTPTGMCLNCLPWRQSSCQVMSPGWLPDTHPHCQRSMTMTSRLLPSRTHWKCRHTHTQVVRYPSKHTNRFRLAVSWQAASIFQNKVLLETARHDNSINSINNSTTRAWITHI